MSRKHGDKNLRLSKADLFVVTQIGFNQALELLVQLIEENDLTDKQLKTAESLFTNYLQIQKHTKDDKYLSLTSIDSNTLSDKQFKQWCKTHLEALKDSESSTRVSTYILCKLE